MILKNKFFVYGLLSVALGACGSDSDKEVAPNSGDLLPNQVISLELNNIEAMSDQHYEGWVITSDGAKSSGRFNINADGDIVAVDASGQVLSILGKGTANFSFEGDKSTASVFVLTIEPDGDSDVGPSSIHYVGGEFTDNLATATLGHQSSIGKSFADVIGSFILATPTQGPDTHNQGVWYIENDAASLSSLPTLDANWVYEGWVVNQATGELVSTGTFTSPSSSDSDGAGATAGPNAAPPFPGQDYINPAMILNDGDHMMVISVEPSPDYDSKPFTLKPLAKLVDANAPVTTTIPMDNISNESDIWIKATIN